MTFNQMQSGIIQERPAICIVGIKAAVHISWPFISGGARLRERGVARGSSSEVFQVRRAMRSSGEEPQLRVLLRQKKWKGQLAPAAAARSGGCAGSMPMLKKEACKPL